MKRNNLFGKDIVNVLREAKDIINLNQMISNLKAEINRLEGKKMALSYNSNLQHLPFNNSKYNYYHY